MKQYSTIMMLSALLAGCLLLMASQGIYAQPAPDGECNTAVMILSADPDTFSTLEALVVAASPVDPEFYAGLSDPDSDPFTAFAPTNEAFEKLFDAFDITAEDALSASPEEIDALLKNHVLPGAIFSSDFTKGEELETAAGETITVDLPNISTESSEVQVIGADVEACQGVVHVIDGVLIPLSEEEFETLEDSPVPEPISEGPGCSTALALALENPDFSSLEALILFAFSVDPEFYGGINDPTAEFTLFAPTNDAFEDLLDALGVRLGVLLGNEDSRELVDTILKYHVLPSTQTAEMLASQESVVTALGSDLNIALPTIEGLFSNATVTSADNQACSGVVHVVDQVLLPVDPADL